MRNPARTIHAVDDLVVVDVVGSEPEAELLGDPDPEKSQRVMQAMLGMKKIEVAGLERAAGQT